MRCRDIAQNIPKIFVLWILSLCLYQCTFTKKIKSGESAYERKQYAVAIDLLEEEFKDNAFKSQKGRKAMMLGRSYDKLLEYDDAIKWFTYATDTDVATEAWFELAQTLKKVEKYDLAIGAFEQLKTLTGRSREYEREISLCKQAIYFKQNPEPFVIDKIFDNSLVSDYAPALFEKEFLIFTSERLDATGNAVYNWTGEKFSDLFITKKENNKTRIFDSAINTPANEGSCIFTKDWNTIYFTRCSAMDEVGDDYCIIMRSDRVLDVWDEPKPLGFIQPNIQYGQPALIENDSVLIFVSDLENPGGTKDLYYSVFEENDWSYPEKMPAIINKEGNEKFPTSDGDTLYFSSDYLPGLGGYDIFKTYLRPDKTWAPPINMGSPLNSGGDDFSLVIDNISKPSDDKIIKHGYFVSSRKSGAKDDIFRFKQVKVEPIPMDKITQDKDVQLVLVVRSYAATYSDYNTQSTIQTGKEVLPHVNLGFRNFSGERVRDVFTDSRGIYITELKDNIDFNTIKASKIDYLGHSYVLDTTQAKTENNIKSIYLDVILEPIIENKEIVLSNIYYDFDKWDLRDEAIPTLEYLEKLLKDNPQIKIELGSHTDCRGDAPYNLELSQKRAQSVIEFLTRRGVPAAKLIAKGYGESLPIKTCSCNTCSEDEHQINRRTSFKILSSDTN